MVRSGIKVKKAIVLAGGRNRRMGPLAPKSALPLANHPNVRRIMEKLHTEGITGFYVGSDRGHVIDIAREGRNPSAQSIHTYLESPRPIGTVTVTKRIVEYHDFPPGEPFLVVASDISHPTMQFRKFARAFQEARQKDNKLVGGVAFLVRPYEEVINRFPVAVIDENDRILRFKERPRDAQEARRIFRRIKSEVVKKVGKEVGVPCLPVNSSYYILLRQIFDLVSEPRSGSRRKYDFGKLMFKRMPPGRMFAFFITESVKHGQPKLNNEWVDMATPSDFWIANWQFINNAARAISGTYIHKHNLRLGQSVNIDPSATVMDCIIGDNVKIGPNTSIRFSIIGNNSQISRATFFKSILLPNTFLNIRPDSPKMNVKESILGGHNYLLINGNELNLSVVARKLVAPSDTGGFIIEPLTIKAEESRMAEECFKKMKFSKRTVDI